MRGSASSPTRSAAASRPHRIAGMACDAGEAACPVRGTGTCRCVPFDVGEGRHRLWGNAVFSPAGLGVNVLGGTRPHVGAVAVAVPRPSRARSGARSGTASVIALVGHKDDEIARSMALALVRRLGIPVVVTVGVHISRARPLDIATFVRNADSVTEDIIARAAPARRHKRRGS